MRHYGCALGYATDYINEKKEKSKRIAERLRRTKAREKKAGKPRVQPIKRRKKKR